MSVKNAFIYCVIVTYAICRRAGPCWAMLCYAMLCCANVKSSYSGQETSEIISSNIEKMY